MKVKITLAVVAALVLLTVMAATAATHYQLAENKRQADNQAKIDAAYAAGFKAAKDAQGVNTVLTKDYNNIYAQCLIGIENYNKLPTAAKPTAKLPLCGEPKIQ